MGFEAFTKGSSSGAHTQRFAISASAAMCLLVGIGVASAKLPKGVEAAPKQDDVIDVKFAEEIPEEKPEEPPPPPPPTPAPQVVVPDHVKISDAPPPPPPPPAPKPAGPQMVSEDDIAAKPTSTPAPPYPEAARSAGITGAVVVRLSIDEGGNVTDATIVKGDANFDAVVLSTVKGWKFEPAKHKDGTPFRSTKTMKIPFRIKS